MGRDVAAQVAAVLGAMRAHADSDRVQTEACYALSSLIDGDPSAQEAAAALGAVGLVISALVAFPDAHRLQWQGIRALAKMAEGRSATQTAVGRAGGVALIVAALGAHQNVAGGGVIKQCCMALEVLVIGHAGNLATVSATPGIRAALQQTLKRFPTSGAKTILKLL
jgi:hypothetical protein